MAISLAILFASNGIAGLATVVGQRLPSPGDAERPWNATIRGGIVLELAFLLPFLGWFVLLPVSLLIGAGATVRSIVHRLWHDKAKPTGTIESSKSIESKDSPEQSPRPSHSGDIHPDLGPLGAST